MILPCDLLSFTQLLLLSVVLVVVNSQSPSWQIDDEGCRTPTGVPGNCLSVRSCPAMMDALLTVKRPLSETASQQLQAYICSITDDYKVCCPSSSIVITEDNSSPVATHERYPTPPVNMGDVSRHKNFHLLPTDCGFVGDVTTIRVINGENADLTEFPWMTLISYRDVDHTAHFKCGGTVINERYILTAAHCLRDRTKILLVRVGEYDINSKRDCIASVCNEPVQDLAIEEIIPHPDYDPKGQVNDIGLLRVTPITLNENNRRPVCLPSGKNDKVTGENVEVSGWGVTQQFSSRNSDILQKAYLPVITAEECRKIYIKFSELIDESRICAGGGKNKSTACRGDSGGPIQAKQRVDSEQGIYFRYIQYGVVSFGMSRCDSPSVFTNVAYYMNWILDNMKP